MLIIQNSLQVLDMSLTERLTNQAARYKTLATLVEHHSFHEDEEYPRSKTRLSNLDCPFLSSTQGLGAKHGGATAVRTFVFCTAVDGICFMFQFSPKNYTIGSPLQLYPPRVVTKSRNRISFAVEGQRQHTEMRKNKGPHAEFRSRFVARRSTAAC